MELRSKRILSIESLPGGYRRGAPGAGAGCSSMRSAGDEELSRRAPVDKITTAETSRDSSSPISSTRSLFPSPNSSPKSYENFSIASPASSHSEFSVDVAQETNTVSETVPTAARTKRPRMKWTDEFNETIIRSYYRITKLESIKITYRKQLHRQFITAYPHLSHVSEQRIADQKRLIICNKLISNTRLDEIKREIAEELQIHTTLNSSINTFSQCDTNCRMRWTDHLNESIIRCYFLVTDLESNMTAYRTKLHSKFIEIHPDLSHISPQRLADQRRSVVNNKLLNETTLQRIKNEVAYDLANHHEHSYTHRPLSLNIEHIERRNNISYNPNALNTESDLTNLVEPQHHSIEARHEETQNTYNGTSTQNTEVNNYSSLPTYINSDLSSETSQNIKDVFSEALSSFSDTDPTTRPFIPKQKTSKKFSATVNYINKYILPEHLNIETDFKTLQTVLYCAAYAAAQCNGAKLSTTPAEKPQKTEPRKPKWQIRLEKKKEDLRAKIGTWVRYELKQRMAFKLHLP